MLSLSGISQSGAGSALSRKAISFIEIFLLLLLALAYLSHLGYTPLNMYTDEARRALVSAEMMLSGDYLTPTLNGEIYLNKPPLYNWIIVIFFKLSGGYSMLAFRLPVVVAGFLMGYVVYFFVKKYTNREFAWFSALAFLTNGRLFLYDSLQGLIDTSFSLVVFLNFMLVFHLGEKKKFWQLFLLTYLLTSVAFLMKGLPALLFQALTLLIYFIQSKNFRMLFRPQHMAGILVFLMLTGSYYLAYFSVNDISPATVFTNLFNESSKRTAVKFGLKDTLVHFVTFPFEMIYHFLPWTLIILAAFQKGIYGRIRQHRFMFYVSWVLVINIIPYWSSVEVFARYLLMFVPLMYCLLLYLYFTSSTTNAWPRKWIDGLILFSCAVVFIFSLSIPFLDIVQEVNGLYWKSALLIAGFGTALYFCVKHPPARLYAFLLALIVLRIGFNWFIVEARSGQYFETKAKADRILEITSGREIYLLRGVQAGNFDAMSFHISTTKGKILRYKDQPDTSAFFIADESQLKSRQYTEYFKFNNYLSDSLKLVRFGD